MSADELPEGTDPEWQSWGITAWAGPQLAALLTAGAPTRATSYANTIVTDRAATEADRYAVTERWCALVLDTFPSARAAEVLRALLAEGELRAALFAALRLGGAAAGEALLRETFSGGLP